MTCAVASLRGMRPGRTLSLSPSTLASPLSKRWLALEHGLVVQFLDVDELLDGRGQGRALNACARALRSAAGRKGGRPRKELDLGIAAQLRNEHGTRRAAEMLGVSATTLRVRLDEAGDA